MPLLNFVFEWIKSDHCELKAVKIVCGYYAFVKYLLLCVKLNLKDIC